eukprot:1157205-Pelagomonas_calceolata.AAC.3
MGRPRVRVDEKGTPPGPFPEEQPSLCTSLSAALPFPAGKSTCKASRGKGGKYLEHAAWLGVKQQGLKLAAGISSKFICKEGGYTGAWALRG